MTRFLQLGEEVGGYGSAASSFRSFRLVGESLKRKPDLVSIRPERRMVAERQVERRRSATGGFDIYLSYPQMAWLFRFLCGFPVGERLASSVYRYTFSPDPHYRPRSLTGKVARDVEMHRYLGLFYTGARLSFSLADKHFGMSFSLLGKDEEPGGAIPTVTEADLEVPAHIGSTGAPSPFAVALSDGVTTWAAWLEMLDLQWSWNRTLRHPERCETPVGLIGGGLPGASGKLKWFYDSSTDWLLDDFRSRANVDFSLLMQGASLGGAYYETLLVDFPVCKVNGDPPTLKGPGRGNIDFNIDLGVLGPGGAAPYQIQVTTDELVSGFTGQLLLNPSAEDNPSTLPHWTEVAGSGWFPFEGSSKDGTHYFHAPDVTNAELRQDVDVSAFADAIDAGLQRFRFTGYVRCFDQAPPDASRQVVEYRDAANTTVLATFDSGEISSVGSWQRVRDTRTAPAGTRYVRVRLLSHRYTGTNNDGFHDLIWLEAL